MAGAPAGLASDARHGFILEALTRADVDIILTYEDMPEKVVESFGRAARSLVESGRITRADLERPVRRILEAKKSMHPGNALLSDIDRTIESLSIEELAAQRMMLPLASEPKATANESIATAKRLVDMKIGGLSFEGMSGDEHKVIDAVRSSAFMNAIPPMLADNSPRELVGMDNPGNKKFSSELADLERGTMLLDGISSKQLSAETMSCLLDALIKR